MNFQTLNVSRKCRSNSNNFISTLPITKNKWQVNILSSYKNINIRKIIFQKFYINHKGLKQKSMVGAMIATPLSTMSEYNLSTF